MFGLILTWQQKLYAAAAFVIWSLACFMGGYAYKWHVDSLADEGRRATQTTAQVTTEAAATAVDTSQVDSLRATVASNATLISSLQRQIAEVARANPAPTACRLPDGLRASINGFLVAPAR